jgi:hypothetical protein
MGLELLLVIRPGQVSRSIHARATEVQWPGFQPVDALPPVHGDRDQPRTRRCWEVVGQEQSNRAAIAPDVSGSGGRGP